MHFDEQEFFNKLKDFGLNLTLLSHTPALSKNDGERSTYLCNSSTITFKKHGSGTIIFDDNYFKSLARNNNLSVEQLAELALLAKD